MSNRQERKARKAAQREGTDVYTHLKPQERNLLGIGQIREPNGKVHLNRSEFKRRARRYGDRILTHEVPSESQ